MNFVDTPLASSTPDYPFQKQPNKMDQLLVNEPHARITRVDFDGLLVTDLDSEKTLFNFLKIKMGSVEGISKIWFS